MILLNKRQGTHGISAAQGNTFHTLYTASGWSYLILREPQALTKPGCQDNIARTVRHHNIHQLIALQNGHRNQTTGPRTREQFFRHLADLTHLCCKEQVLVGLKVPQRNHCGNVLIR